jgi:hypothetical protein
MARIASRAAAAMVIGQVTRGPCRDLRGRPGTRYALYLGYLWCCGLKNNCIWSHFLVQFAMYVRTPIHPKLHRTHQWEWSLIVKKKCRKAPETLCSPLKTAKGIG